MWVFWSLRGAQLTVFASPRSRRTYKESTTRGGVFTVILAVIIALLIWTEAKEYLW